MKTYDHTNQCDECGTPRGLAQLKLHRNRPVWRCRQCGWWSYAHIPAGTFAITLGRP